MAPTPFMNLSTRSILCSRSSSQLSPAFSTQLRLFSSAGKRQEGSNPNEETRTIILSPILDTPMPWSEYLPLRLEKRRYQRLYSYPSSIIGGGAACVYYSSLSISSATTLPAWINFFFNHGPKTLVIGALFAVLGKILGESIWRFKYSRSLPRIEARERELYRRIVRNRVDPAGQSTRYTPPPDYHGENIGSLHQYRKWLRDQGKFRRRTLDFW